MKAKNILLVAGFCVSLILMIACVAFFILFIIFNIDIIPNFSLFLFSEFFLATMACALYFLTLYFVRKYTENQPEEKPIFTISVNIQKIK